MRLFLLYFIPCLLAIGFEDVPMSNDNVEFSPESSVVIDLSQSNFNQFISEHTAVIVEFFAPWCHHCKQLAPHYEEAAVLMKNADNPMAFAKVDATVEQQLSNEYGIEGYPTLKIFHKNSPKPIDYDGPRGPGSAIADHLKQYADPHWMPPPSDVVVLTSENFTSFTTNEELTLVEFYAPWCGHCKRLEPKFEKAATILKKETNIRLAKVDATAEQALQLSHNVTGYPTLFVYRKGGKRMNYNGEQSEQAIISYMKELQSSPSRELRTGNDYKNLFRRNDQPVLIGIFHDENDPLYSLFIDYAYVHRNNFQFGHIFGSLASLSDVQAPAIVLQHHPDVRSKFEKEKFVFNQAESTMENLEKFVEQYQVPLVGILTMENRQKSYFNRRPICIVIYELDFSFDHRERTQYWRNKVLKIAQNYRDEFTFAIADETKMGALLKETGLEESDEDVNVVCYDQKGRKYRMEDDEEFTSESLEDFVNRVNKGKVTPFILSQPIPKQASINGVRVLVGRNFNEIVRDPTKDAFILFYAPWCGHCTKLKPTIISLAQHYASKSNLVIAQMDVTANDIPEGFDINGFPTLYFVTKTNKLTKYEGNRDLDDLINFIETNMESKIEL